MRLFHSSFRLSAAPVALTALSALSVLAVSTVPRAAHAQSAAVTITLGSVPGEFPFNFAFTGGNSGSLTLLSGMPQTFNIGTYTASSTFTGNGATTGTLGIAYTPSGGAAGTASGSASYNYTYSYHQAPPSNNFSVSSSSNTFTFNNGGTLTFTVLNTSKTSPGSSASTPGQFSALYTAPAGGVAAPEPGSIALALTGSGPLLLGLVRRKRRRNEAAKQAA